MQFYRDGFYVGDPAVLPADNDHPFEPGRTEVDVLIVGSGPAGLILAAQLSQFPEVTTRIVERRTGPLTLGRADGVAVRTVETFEAFGLAQKLLQESYWVNEVTFWNPSKSNPDEIVRTGRVRDTEEGLSEFPHVIVNQARIMHFLIEFMKNSASRLEVEYDLAFTSLTVDRSQEYPVRAVLTNGTTGEEEVVHAKYVVGADGAHSAVRDSIGRRLEGDAANQAWGVIDVLTNTDFPDIRFKSAIHSANHGSILIIPREGGYLVRLYVDLGTITEDNRAAIRAMTGEEIVEAANRALHPYSLDVKEIAWTSVYEVAQRIADAFADEVGPGSDPRVFLMGDACHTHSAKAGQGMNVSMQDGYNLGWKLAAVLRGHSSIELLETYSDERQPVAQELIDFDREWAAMMASTPSQQTDDESEEDAGTRLQKYFSRQARYTAGVTTRYRPNLLTGGGEHQDLATGYPIGMRFQSAQVVRAADARLSELGHAHRADGRWRIYLFAGEDESVFLRSCEWLGTDPDSPLVRTQRLGGAIDEIIDVRGVLQRPHAEIDVTTLPEILRPHSGALGLQDHEKIYSAAGTSPDIYDVRGVDRKQGCAIIVRPDQYVANVLPLDGLGEISDSMSRILT